MSFKTLKSVLLRVLALLIIVLPVVYFRVTKAEAAVEPPSFSCVDIKSVCNVGFKDEIEGDQKGGIFDQGKRNLSAIVTGKIKFKRIPFEIIEPSQNNGNSAVCLYGQAKPFYPDEVEVKVGKKAKTIYFLQLCAWGVTQPQEVIASYELHYADAIQTIDLHNTLELVDWTDKTKKASKSIKAWSGISDDGTMVSVYMFPYKNPYPDREIRSIKFKSNKTMAVPALLAITLSSSPVPDGLVTAEEKGSGETYAKNWVNFRIPWDIPVTNIVDVSFLNDKPAGKSGFLQVKDGHFKFPDGTRQKFWGTTLWADLRYPPHDVAEKVASNLASLGVNLVRFPGLDDKSAGLMSSAYPDSQHLDEDKLERFDYLVYQLKKNGIYVYLDLNNYRTFEVADGMPETMTGGGKPFSTFIPEMIDLLKKFDRQLLLHTNQYTGLKYIDEPAVAMLELCNEDTLWGFLDFKAMPKVYLDVLNSKWNKWLLDKYAGAGNLAKAWTDTEGNAALLPGEDPSQNNVYLPTPLIPAGDPRKPFAPKTAAARLNDAALFIYDVQNSYFNEMYAFLRSIGAKALIKGGDITYGAGDVKANSLMDFTTSHLWGEWDGSGSYSLPSKKDPISHSVGLLNLPSLNTVVDKPQVITEWYISAMPVGVPGRWYEYRCADILLYSAYAALQDWDGLIAWSYGWDLNPSIPQEGLMYYGMNNNDPVVMAQYPVGALLFLRGDVEKAKRVVQIGHSLVDTFYAQSPGWTRDDMRPFGVLSLVSRVKNVFFDEAYPLSTADKADIVIPSGLSASGSYKGVKNLIPYLGYNSWGDLYNKQKSTQSLNGKGDLTVSRTAEERTDPKFLLHAYLKKAKDLGFPEFSDLQINDPVYHSDTRQLTLDWQKGVFVIDTAQLQAIVGYSSGQEAATANLTVNSKTGFSAISLVAVDGKALGLSKNILLTAVARAENSNMVFDETKDSVQDKGGQPVIMEPVEATISLKSTGVSNFKVFSLTNTGARKEGIPYTTKKDGISFDVGGKYKTCWYEIIRE